MRACVHEVQECVRACMRACVSVPVCVCVHMFLCACVHTFLCAADFDVTRGPRLFTMCCCCLAFLRGMTPTEEVVLTRLCFRSLYAHLERADKRAAIKSAHRVRLHIRAEAAAGTQGGADIDFLRHDGGGEGHRHGQSPYRLGSVHLAVSCSRTACYNRDPRRVGAGRDFLL